MALTLDNILTIAQVGAACHVGSTDVDSNFRNRAITRAAIFMGLNFTGALADGNNPFVSGSFTEDRSGDSKSDILQLRHWPVTAVSDITDKDGTSYNYTEGDDFHIEDYDGAEGSEKIVAYTGWLIKHNGAWSKGTHNYIVTYTAGYSSTTFPEGLREGILIIAMDLYARGADRNVQSKKIFQKSVTYVTRNGVSIPEEAAAILEQYMPPKGIG